MPDEFTISQLPTTSSFNNLDLMEIAQVDAQSVTGYSSYKKTMNQIGDKLNNSIEYSVDLNTTSKKIIGAINEVNAKGIKDLSDTTITTPSSGQVLSYDGSKWVNTNKDYYTKSEIDTKLNYFINEKAVGVWIDNKTIYRCVFTGFNMSTSANTWAETTVSASNLSTLISGRIIDSSGQSFACSVGWSNNKVALNMPLARSNLTTLILEYTKA